MARQIDNKIGGALKEPVGPQDRSAEAKHRTLREALARARRGAFAEVLGSMPDVGVDTDFERVDSIGRFPNILD